MDIDALLYLFVVFILLAIIADKMPFSRIAKRISGYSKSSLSTISSDHVSDEQKQKLLLKNSGGMLIQSCLMMSCLLPLLLLLYLSMHAEWLNPRFDYRYFSKMLPSIEGILVSIAAFGLYFTYKYFFHRSRYDKV